MKLSDLWFNHIDAVRLGLAILLGLSIPISTSFTNIVLIAVSLCLASEVKQHPHFINILRQHPLILPTFLLFGVMVCGILYTSASWKEAFSMLSKYRELLLIPLFFLLFRDEVTRQWGVYAFLAAMAITLLLSYVLAFTGWDVGKGTADNPFIFKNHITQGLLMSLAAYFVAVFWLEETVTWRRWLYTLILLLAIANVVFMTQGRTGYLVLASLILLFLYQAYQWRGIIVGIIGLTLLGTAAYWASHVVQNRVNKVAENVESYKHGQSKTSIGLRFEFYRNSLSLVKQKPVFGAGTGSFANEYAKLAQQRNLTATTNPHNEYLMIAVQWGLLGLGLFLYLFYRLWQLSQDLLPAYDWLAQGLILTMVTGCLVNSLLLDFTEGHVFAYLVGALFAGYEPKSLVDVTIPEND